MLDFYLLVSSRFEYCTFGDDLACLTLLHVCAPQCVLSSCYASIRGSSKRTFRGLLCNEQPHTTTGFSYKQCHRSHFGRTIDARSPSLYTSTRPGYPVRPTINYLASSIRCSELAPNVRISRESQRRKQKTAVEVIARAEPCANALRGRPEVISP